MQQVSSNTTLLFKIFIPVFWLVFFGAFTLVLFISNIETQTLLPVIYLRFIMSGVLLSGIVFFYFTFLKLKREEMSADGVYVSNYLKSFKYPYSNIERIEERNRLLFSTVRLYFKRPTSFGKHITFLPASDAVHKHFLQYLG